MFNNPYYLCLSIVVLAFGVSSGLGVCVHKWLFVIIFLVFLGGIIILFFYIIRLSKPKKQARVSSLVLWLFLLALAPGFSLVVAGAGRPAEIFFFQNIISLAYIGNILLIILVIRVKILDYHQGSVVRHW